jgi:hypothetical protein
MIATDIAAPNNGQAARLRRVSGHVHAFASYFLRDVNGFQETTKSRLKRVAPWLLMAELRRSPLSSAGHCLEQYLTIK